MLVQSDSNALVSYVLTWERPEAPHLTCSCPWFTHQGRATADRACKHIIRAAMAVARVVGDEEATSTVRETAWALGEQLIRAAMTILADPKGNADVRNGAQASVVSQVIFERLAGVQVRS